MKIQVIIITHQRKDHLNEALQSIKSELPQETEIHILINGPDEETLSFIQSKYLESPSNQALKINVQTSEKKLSPAEARNTVLRKINPPPVTEIGQNWILFLDDDARLIPGTFKKFENLKAAHPDCLIFGGPNLTPPESKTFESWTGTALASPFATFHSNPRYRNGYGNQPGSERNLILCCLWVEATLVAGRPVFAEYLVCAEENAWLIDLERPMLYSDQLACFHHRRSDFATLAKQIIKYARGRGQIWRLINTRFPLTYWVPSLALLIQALGLLDWIISRDPNSFWLILNGTYLGLCFVFSALELMRDLDQLRTQQRRNRLLSFVAVAALFPVIHLSYGLGMLQGFFKPHQK